VLAERHVAGYALDLRPVTWAPFARCQDASSVILEPMLDARSFEAMRCGVRRCSMLVLLLLGLCWGSPASALDVEDVPAPLRPWLPWVLEQAGDGVCPALGEGRACVWPRRLELDLSATGGRFRLGVSLDRRASVALPGGDESWPQEVTADGAAAVVQAAGDTPVVSLAPGEHTIEGRFAWRRLPETLLVPARIALLALEVDGQRVLQPKRDTDRVWLKGAQATEEVAESLTLEVFRKLDDQVPFTVQTRLVLEVSGRSRELRVPTALTPGSVPIQLESSLPARIEPSGELRLQVLPGRHELTIDAVYPSPPERLSAPRHAPPGPSREVWVFVPHTQYRQVELQGGLSIDPQRTNLPAAWRALSAHQLEGGGELVLQTLRRGQPQPQPNRLALERELWLDLDGQGYTVRDHLSGAMSRTWRLDLLHGVLGHAAVGGVDQLITRHPTTGGHGLELRQGTLDLNAEWRLDDARAELPAVAWSENVEQLATTLHLPPGWQLLGAAGADSVSQSWLSRWDLFAVFLVLVVAVAVAKVDTWAWGALALLALLVAHGEPHAPRFVWVAILGCIALLAALPAGRFRQLVRGLAFIVGLVLLESTLSFAVSQIRAALYPQVQDVEDVSSWIASDSRYESAAAPAQAPGAPPPLTAMPPAEEAETDMREKRKGVPRGSVGGLLSAADSYGGGGQDMARATLLEQDPNAQIQTGPGVPTWRWHAWRLGWSGPVEQSHTLDLYLLSPSLGAVLSVLRILLIGLLTVWALRLAWRRGRSAPPGAPSRAPSAAPAALGLGLALLCSSAPAQADIPTPELLQELKERMQPPRACDGPCVLVPRLELAVSDGELRLDVEVHAAERAAYRLPGPVARWSPVTIEVDARPAAAVLLNDDGYLHVRLDPGRHRVRARGPIAGRQLALDPGTPPRWVNVDAPGWDVSGLSESGRIEGSLGLVRPLPADATRGGIPEDEPATLPTWSILTRTFSFGVTWSVRSELQRVSPPGSLIVARVPLLPGERVTSANVPVDAGVATLRLSGDATTVSIDSVIEPMPQLTLTATPSSGYSERWVIRCGPIFRCDASGIAPIQHEADGRWEPVFAPWPTEKLALDVVRPAAATGQTATVDSAQLVLHPGVRLLRAELAVHVRVSTQTSYELSLPEGSQVDLLSIGGKSEPIRQEGSKVALILMPGQHDLRVGWQQPGGFVALFRSPRVQFGPELINAELSVHLPDERWLLFARGPGWGPAILFWGHLVLILLLAPVLARVPRSPLGTWQWAMLALGLTQVPLPVAGIVVGWFFAVAYQGRARPSRPFWFNARQLLLLGVTLVFLGCLFAAVYDSLLNTPSMEVVGSDSSERLLRWYVDRTPGTLPEAWVLTTSLWVWRGVMLLWALWLAHSLVGWLGWAWEGFRSDGVWKPWRKAPAAAKG
jgi:hypothetical protein